MKFIVFSTTYNIEEISFISRQSSEMLSAVFRVSIGAPEEVAKAWPMFSWSRRPYPGLFVTKCQEQKKEIPLIIGSLPPSSLDLKLGLSIDGLVIGKLEINLSLVVITIQ